MKSIDVETAAQQLHDAIDDVDGDSIATLYEFWFAHVQPGTAFYDDDTNAIVFEASEE